MLHEKILEAAAPYLKDKTITDAVVGISLMGCCLNDSLVGVAYVMRDELPGGCSTFADLEKIIGKNALEVAREYTFGRDNIQRGMATAILTAAENELDIPDDTTGDSMGLDITSADTVGMIGMIKPIAAYMKQKAGKLYVFDKGLEAGGEPSLDLMAAQPEAIPECDILIVTGSSTINRTAEGLINMAKKARQIIFVGSSTPMFAAGWEQTPVNVLAGSFWKSEYKKEIFRAISLAGGTKNLGKYSVKKYLRLK